MRIAAAAVALAALAACGGGTQMANMWVAPEYKGHAYKKIVAVAMANSEGNRRAAEDAMVAEISKRAPAVASYNLAPDATGLGADTFRSILRGANADGVVVMRFLRRDKETQYTPGYTTATPYWYGPGGYWGAWGGWYGAWTSPGYYTEYRVYTLETSFYDLTTDKLAWVGTTESTDPSSVTTLVGEIAGEIRRELTKRGVL